MPAADRGDGSDTAGRAGSDLAPSPLDAPAGEGRSRRRALLLAGAPGLVVFVVLGGIGSVLAPLIALPVGLVLGLVVWAMVWRGATDRLLGALDGMAIDEERLPRPYVLVEGLCATMGLPVPALSLVDDPRPDALAIGRSPDDAVLVLTSGLVDTLDPVELEGVLAHELTHVKDGDVALATIVAVLVLPLAGMLRRPGDLVHRVVGSGREFDTDRRAVGVTRYPPGLSGALRTMADRGGSVPSAGRPRHRVETVTRWLWTVPLGGQPVGDAAVGELDAPSVRMAALDEW